VEPRARIGCLAPGATDDAIATAISAGMRIEGFPILVGWSAPFADFRRYVPISPGIDVDGHGLIGSLLRFGTGW
jgi:hypothetical protein